MWRKRRQSSLEGFFHTCSQDDGLHGSREQSKRDATRGDVKKHNAQHETQVQVAEAGSFFFYYYYTMTFFLPSLEKYGSNRMLLSFYLLEKTYDVRLCDVDKWVVLNDDSCGTLSFHIAVNNNKPTTTART